MTDDIKSVLTGIIKKHAERTPITLEMSMEDARVLSVNCEGMAQFVLQLMDNQDIPEGMAPILEEKREGIKRTIKIIHNIDDQMRDMDMKPIADKVFQDITGHMPSE